VNLLPHFHFIGLGVGEVTYVDHARWDRAEERKDLLLKLIEHIFHKFCAQSHIVSKRRRGTARRSIGFDELICEAGVSARVRDDTYGFMPTRFLISQA
jgi:hypothetical protein